MVKSKKSFGRKVKRGIKMLKKYRLDQHPVKVKIWSGKERYYYCIIHNGQKIIYSTQCRDVIRYILSHYIFHIEIEYNCFKKLCTNEGDVTAHGSWLGDTVYRKLSYRGIKCHYFELHWKKDKYTIDRTSTEIYIHGSIFNLKIPNNVHINRIQNIQSLKLYICLDSIFNNYKNYDFIDKFNLWNCKDISIKVEYKYCTYKPKVTVEQVKEYLKTFRTFISDLGCIIYSNCEKYNIFINKLNKLSKNKNITLNIAHKHILQIFDFICARNRQLNPQLNTQRNLNSLCEICANSISTVLKDKKIESVSKCKLWNSVKISPSDIRKQIY